MTRKSWRGEEDELRNGYGDDVARLSGRIRRLEVLDLRVLRVAWWTKGLKGTLPAEIWGLDGLWVLDLQNNEISGHLPIAE